MLSIITTNTWVSQEILILRENISLAIQQRLDISLNNGMLSTLTHGRENQPRVNSMKNMDFTSKDHSMSFQLWVQEDTLRSSITKTWSSRQETTKRDKFGGSIKEL
jgi:hypothetical protein